MRLFACLCLLIASWAGFAEGPPSFSKDVQPILNSQCVYCHVTGAENGGLNLARRHSHAALMAQSTEASMPRVTPGDPESSYLIHKLRGTHLEVGGSGSVMPIYDPPRPFPEAMRSVIEDWVAQGAPNN